MSNVRKRGRRPRATIGPRRASLPEVPPWLVCSEDEWRQFRDTSDGGPVDAGRRLALHGRVGEIATIDFGGFDEALLAIALDPRMLRGSGSDSPIHVTLLASGRTEMTLVRSVSVASAACLFERLRRLDEGPGYREPQTRTAGDVARESSREGFRRVGTLR